MGAEKARIHHHLSSTAAQAMGAAESSFQQSKDDKLTLSQLEQWYLFAGCWQLGMMKK